jgi:hypothetical protein
MPRRIDFGREVTYPFISVKAVVELCWHWCLWRQAKVDLGNNDAGVVNNMSTHSCDDVKSVQ